ncbi:L-serine dehydratase, beta chain [Urinicoccus massiliensis]|uniref:L-serine deaminase n=1 Tax=Urinicoccus massiliensis TaxID=1723382 RepID=A0A8H2M701_9FIRM|nr:L-serine ammonia-lyase, iron-sulfur-dependent subunit beta [Urinicoccus massiliensis]VFB17123.1 L-serine dehydratase, beta chain [Urinicoccus massiliensis]
MKEYSIFQVMGPIMVGPSSSHTAGACRIANSARNLCPFDFSKAVFILHGSFLMTYKGHGTDRALLAGILGVKPDDSRIIQAFDLADQAGLDYRFERGDLGHVHPNSVKIILSNDQGDSFDLVGSSIGGGNIELIELDGNKISFRNQFPTFILQYQEQKGVIARVSRYISDAGYNIENIDTEKRGKSVTLSVELTHPAGEDLKNQVLHSDLFNFAKYLDVVD